jgi:hypothetical protein
MLLRTWRAVTIVLAALMLSLTSAHVLELPQKLAYDAEMYAAVNGSLYRSFASVGAFYTLASIGMALGLVVLVRGRGPTYRFTLAGAVCLLVAFGIWLTVVAPVNWEIARTDPGSVTAAWSRLRQRWELGHVAGFIATLAAFSLLVLSVIVETPRRPFVCVSRARPRQAAPRRFGSLGRG